MSARGNQRTNIVFVVWFFVAASFLVIAFLALAGMQGLDAAGALVAIPNIVIILACGMGLLICVLSRPKFEKTSRPVMRGTVLTFVLAAALVLWSGVPFGFYKLEVQVLDSKGHPVPGISIRVLGQKTGTSIRDVFVPNDLETTTGTDSVGHVTIKVSRFQDVGGIVNAHLYGKKKTNPEYRFATFNLWPADAGKVSGHISWSRSGVAENVNMRFASIEAFEPGTTTLHVFLPEVGGNDFPFGDPSSKASDPKPASGIPASGELPH
jgi:amino acid transporter